MDYFEFLKADILCLLHDYGEMTAEGIASILGLDEDETDLEDALFDLVAEEKIKEVGEDKYAACDELGVKRLKKTLPGIF